MRQRPGNAVKQFPAGVDGSFGTYLDPTVILTPRDFHQNLLNSHFENNIIHWGLCGETPQTPTFFINVYLLMPYQAP